MLSRPWPVVDLAVGCLALLPLDPVSHARARSKLSVQYILSMQYADDGP